MSLTLILEILTEKVLLERFWTSFLNPLICSSILIKFSLTLFHEIEISLSLTVGSSGVGVGSGYYFSKPLSVNEFSEYVSQLKMKQQLAEISELEDKEI